MFVITKNIHSYVITLYFLYDERPCTYFVLLPFVRKRFLMRWNKKEEQYGEKYITSYLIQTFKRPYLKFYQHLCLSIIHQVSIQKYSYAIHIRYIYDRPCFKIRTDTFTYVVTRLINQLMLVLSRLPYTWSHIRLTVIHAHSWHPYFNAGSLLCVSDIYFMEILLFCSLMYFDNTKTVQIILSKVFVISSIDISKVEINMT